MPKIAAKMIGMTIDSRCDAACRFSNCPPHSMKLPGGSLTCAATLLLRFGDEGAQVVAADIGLHHDAPLAVFAADLVQAFGKAELAPVRCSGTDARDPPSPGSITGKRPDRVEIVARGAVEAHDDVESPVAFEDDAGFAPAERSRDGVGDVLQGQAVAGDGIAIELDVELREACRLLDLDVGCARNGVQDRRDLLRRRAHCVEIVAVELDRDVAAHAGDQFVEPQLDRLADLEGVADERFELGFSTRSITSSLVSTPSGHSSCGFRMTNVSEIFGGIGSVATSAVPVFEKMKATSGSEITAFSTCRCISSDWFSDVEGMRMRLHREIAFVQHAG